MSDKGGDLSTRSITAIRNISVLIQAANELSATPTPQTATREFGLSIERIKRK